jgi:branched-subunit amino acid ABC-type transport system permease component
MNPAPGQTSGNGNPAILLLGVILIMFCCLVYLWNRILNDYPIKPLVLSIGVSITLIHIVISILYQRNAFLEYREVLAETYKKDFGFVDWQYIESITSFLSIHVNKQYFNLNTYFMFLSASILLSLIVYFGKKLRNGW